MSATTIQMGTSAAKTVIVMVPVIVMTRTTTATIMTTVIMMVAAVMMAGTTGKVITTGMINMVEIVTPIPVLSESEPLLKVLACYLGLVWWKTGLVDVYPATEKA